MISRKFVMLRLVELRSAATNDRQQWTLRHVE
jgi:hypothetical protein